MKRTFLVTGASRGIGKAITEHLIAANHTVIGCSRSESDFDHPNYQHYCLDVSDEEAVTELFFTLRKQSIVLDGLINNAGIASMNAFALTPAKTMRTVFDVNVQGTFLFCQKALSLLKKAEHPRIVNFTTVAVPLNLAGEAVYAASKSAVETLTRILAKEYATFGITCNAIGPSPIDTALIKNVPKDKIKALIDQQAIRKMAETTDVLNLLDFYLNESSDLITGQVIYLAGVF